MQKKIDLQKEIAKIWEQAKENLKELGQNTLTLAQKGEQEVVRASKVGKLQLDIVSLNLKKENVFRLVGKKIYEAHGKKEELQDIKVTSLLSQLNNLNNQIRGKKAQIAKLKKEKAE
ncbi:MAG: hypothetical protein V1727_06805 [Candidatus Omnitrophota bacterium]